MADQWYAIVAASGALVSTGTVLAPSQHYTDAGLTVVPLTGDPAGQVWNATTKTFGPAQAPVNSYPTLTWIQRFTAAEFMGFKNSLDPEIQFFMFQITSAQSVTPTDPLVQAGLEYAVSIGLLTAPRAALIGAN
jgi:hypothetical protein